MNCRFHSLLVWVDVSASWSNPSFYAYSTLHHVEVFSFFHWGLCLNKIHWVLDFFGLWIATPQGGPQNQDPQLTPRKVSNDYGDRKSPEDLGLWDPFHIGHSWLINGGDPNLLAGMSTPLIQMPSQQEITAHCQMPWVLGWCGTDMNGWVPGD